MLKIIGICRDMLEAGFKALLTLFGLMFSAIVGLSLYIFKHHLKEMSDKLDDIKVEQVEQGNRLTAVETSLKERKAG